MEYTIKEQLVELAQLIWFPVHGAWLRLWHPNSYCMWVDDERED